MRHALRSRDFDKSHVLGLCLATALLAPSSAADEVRLHDGRVLIGTAERRGTIVLVRTLDGTVRVPADSIARWRTEADLRAGWQRLRERLGDAPNPAHTRVQLARIARDSGLYPEMWSVIEEQLADADTPRPAGFGDLLASLEPVVLPRKWRGRSTETRVRELIYRIRPGTPAGVAAAVEEILVREPGAAPFLRARARGASRAYHRLAALRALARRGEDGDDTFIYRTAILDGSASVRRDVTREVRELRKSTEAVRYLAPGLMHAQPEVRIRTADAYANLMDPAAVDILVAAGPFAATPPKKMTANGATRAHIAFLDQQSYVRDFDVEVAMASFIADPQIDVLQSGVVLDVTVHAVVTYRTRIVASYRNALRRLTGSDPGADPRTWATWRALQRPRGAATSSSSASRRR